jgi:hypothetical protein
MVTIITNGIQSSIPAAGAFRANHDFVLVSIEDDAVLPPVVRFAPRRDAGQRANFLEQ